MTVHCSPGTGRTGTIIGCDIAIRSLEQPMRSVDVPQIVYFVRRGRASAVQTREQYEFIYKVRIDPVVTAERIFILLKCC